MRYITIKYRSDEETYIPATNCTSEHFNNPEILELTKKNIINKNKPICPAHEENGGPKQFAFAYKDETELFYG